MRETCASSLPVDPIVSTCFVAPRLVVVTSFISQRHRRPPPSQPFGKIPWSSSPVGREKGSVVAVRRRGGGGGFVAGGECTARGSACRSADSLSLFLPPPRRHSSATGLPSSSSTPWRGPRSSRRRSRTRRGPLLLPSNARREQLRPASPAGSSSPAAVQPGGEAAAASGPRSPRSPRPCGSGLLDAQGACHPWPLRAGAACVYGAGVGGRAVEPAQPCGSSGRPLTSDEAILPRFRCSQPPLKETKTAGARNTLLLGFMFVIIMLFPARQPSKKP